MYKILQRNTLIELSQIILDLEKQGRNNHIIDQVKSLSYFYLEKSNCIIIIRVRI